MTFKLGSTDINKLYLGSTEIKKVYLGSTLIHNATASGLLLDSLSNCAYYCAPRKVRTAYTGRCCEVQRNSDNVTFDVGFDSNDELSLDSPVWLTSGSSSCTDGVSVLGDVMASGGYTDVDSLGSSDSALLQTYYDQSGNSNDASQSTKSYQYTVVLSGALITKNGKAAFWSPVGSTGFRELRCYELAAPSTNWTMFHIASVDSISTENIIGTTGVGYNSDGLYIHMYTDSTGARFCASGSTVTIKNHATTPDSAVAGQLHINSVIHKSDNTAKFGLDGNLLASFTSAGSWTVGSYSYYSAGYYTDSQWRTQGYLSEVGGFSADMSSDWSTIIADQQSFYGIS